MHEDLIGYLLGALEPDEAARVDEALRRDPDLRKQLEELRRTLLPLEQLDEEIEPPFDLIARTMETIEAASPIASDDFEVVSAKKVSLSKRDVAFNHEYRWRLIDICGMAVAVVLLAGLVLPGIVRQRATARMLACQSQLREAGIALVAYLTRTEDGRFPRVSEEGPDAFSGMYRVALAENDLMPKTKPLWCPSLDAPSGWENARIPTHYEILKAGADELEAFQRYLGGHYAYTLGIHEKGIYSAPRYQDRPRFAILADAPQQNAEDSVAAHDGQGFNILFEDGHIEFFEENDTWKLGDHPFLNRQGRMAAGLDPDDAVLGRSESSPFSLIRYRP